MSGEISKELLLSSSKEWDCICKSHLWCVPSIKKIFIAAESEGMVKEIQCVFTTRRVCKRFRSAAYTLQVESARDLKRSEDSKGGDEEKLKETQCVFTPLRVCKRFRSAA